MTQLLVSVRSVTEAEAAVRGGAAVIDIKEPHAGPLGRASSATWRAIRAAVPEEIPVSVALGELRDFAPASLTDEDLRGISFQKFGPLGLGSAWQAHWLELRRHWPGRGGWVAVSYLDWEAAQAPDPDQVLAAALAADDCPGVLFDTWNKTQGCPLVADAGWHDRIRRIQDSGRFVALAGRLDRAAIRRLVPLRPDLFAVRSAACVGQDRRAGTIDARLVAELVGVVAESGSLAG